MGETGILSIKWKSISAFGLEEKSNICLPNRISFSSWIFLVFNISSKSILLLEQKLDISEKKGSNFKSLKELSLKLSKLNILVAEPEEGINLDMWTPDGISED